MKKFRWQILVIVMTLVVVGVLLLAQQPSLNPILPQPTSGGIYTEALIGSLGRLNPILDFNNQADHDIDRLLFTGLFKFDSRGNPQTDLAKSWAANPDGTIYNISIRSNAVWQDGQPVTSDDFIYTLGLLRSQYSSYPQDVRVMWDQIEVKRLDDRTLQFVLPEPFAPFLDYLSFSLLPRHLLEKVPGDQLANTDFNLNPVGTGPYQFDHLMVENSQITGVVLKVSDTYYGKKPFIDQIVFRYYPTGRAALNAYHAGDVLGISQITPDILTEALMEPNLELYTGRMPRLTLVLFNLKNNDTPFLQDKTIRRALLLGLNRQHLVDSILQSQAIVADSPLLPGTWATYEGVPHVEYDTDAAIVLLKDAGYNLPPDSNVRAKDGKQLAFTLIYPDDTLHTQLAQSIQQDWTAIGILVTLQPVTYESLMNDSLIPHIYQAALVDLDSSRSPDPDPYPFWHQSESTGGQNYSQWDNRQASEYLEQARVVFDKNIRAKLYRNFQAIFAKELPALPLFYPVYTFGVDMRVNGVQLAPLFDPSDRFNTISDWYLITRRAVDETMQPSPIP